MKTNYASLVGDININPLQTNQEPTCMFINSILGENFIPHITLPARITDHSATLIDHIVIRPHKHTVGETIVSGNIYFDISDHLPNFICFGEKTNK